MKVKLRQIFDDLSSGKLSQAEALEKIKTLKLREQGKKSGTLLVTPIWQESGVEASADSSNSEYAEHHVILCELPAVDVKTLRLLLPKSQCLALQAGEQNNIAQRYSEYALACFERIRGVLEGKPQGKVLVQIVLAGHQEQALFAGLSGLLKTAALESPQLIGQLIIATPLTTAEELARQLQEEKTGKLDPLVQYEHGGRQVLHWQEVAADLGKQPIAFKDHGVYLITGGLGGLGVVFTKEILAHSGSLVVLTGRSELSAEKQVLLEGLSVPPGRVSYRRLDLGDLDQVKQLMVSIKDKHHKLNGILHSAGMAADNFILKKTSAEFSQVLAPKVTGTYNLDQASQDVELDFFVLFSSAAGAMGNLGQADYAAANGFMDQFAAYRNHLVAARQRHGRTRSINWPLWQAGGMKMDAATQELLQRTTGMQPMQTATGLQAFYRTLALPFGQMLVVEGYLPRLRRALLAGRPIQPELAPPLTPVEQSVAAEINSETLAEKTQDYLRKQFSRLLKLPSQQIDPQAAMERYGIDSILAMKLTNELEKAFGPLSKTLFFEYQTVADLTTYFTQAHAARLAKIFAATDHLPLETTSAAARLEARPDGQATTDSSRRFSCLTMAVPAALAEEHDPIAMIGLSGRYPEAVNIDAYWNNLRDGKDCIVEVPKERWDWQQYFSDDRTKSGQHYSKWGGFIAGVDEFDPLFFNISPKEAKYIDPQERLFLQHAWMAMEDAGYTRAGLQVPSAHDLPGQVGVYVGLMYSEYQLFGAEASMRDDRMGFAASVASIANRVSYFLNLHGPSMTLDTMCSSSLTAIHLACQDLKQGRTSLAIAGGVNVSIHPNKYLVLSAGQFISSDGHCQSFGEGGDGYIPGEGVGVVVLKRLSEAKRDGDHIYGIIRGSALNHGGKTNGYTVPNPQAQAGVISRALAEAGTGARQISYIEAHGTGTKLGDPIEIAALSKAFQQYTQDKEFCLIGSAKSNIGHCESAAGIAGLTKVLLQMQHQQIVPSLHSAQLNPHIDFPDTPFTVNQSLRPWEPPVLDGQIQPRIAGISSFGAGGSNAHMIVEEYQAPLQPALVFAQVVILLSARTAAQLQQKAVDLLDFVRARPGTFDLVSLAYTLQVGREGMEERLGLVVNSVDQLAEKMQAFVAGDLAIEDFYQGQVKRNKEALSLFRTDPDLQQTVHKWIASGKLSKLLELWVKGLELDWNDLYPQAKPQRMSLPTYPFAKERYWIDIAGKQGVSSRSSPVARSAAFLHPLLHGNTSVLGQQRYSSTFTGEEFFLADLPGVAYLEMARAALEQAWPDRPESMALELRHTVWAQPVPSIENKQVSIALFAKEHQQIDYEIYAQDAGQEIVHCQGRAVWTDPPAKAKLDLEQLKRQIGPRQVEPCDECVDGPAVRAIAAIYQGNHQLLAHLRLPADLADSDYVLHPSLLRGALQACSGLLNRGPDSTMPLPSAIESLRIVSACSPEMFAWIRYSTSRHAGDETVKLDIDLCDERGNVSVQMREISWHQLSVTAVAPFIKSPTVRRDMAFVPYHHAVLIAVERTKPSAIALSAPGTHSAPATMQHSRARPSITLPSAGSGFTIQPATQEGAAPALSSLRLFDRGDGLFSVEVPVSPSSMSAKDTIAELLQALHRMRQEPSLKALMLIGMERCFSSAGPEAYNQAVEQKLYQALVSFPYPVVAVVQRDAIGAGFLAVALCDFMVGSEDATYGYADPQTGWYPTPGEAALLSERFGAVQAQDLLYLSTPLTGQQLLSKGWTCPLVPGTEVQAHAELLASTLATKSQESLGLLKQHLTRHLRGLVNTLERVDPPAPGIGSATVTEAIISPVEHIVVDSPVTNVAVIRLVADHKVELQAMVEDLSRIFAGIQQVPGYRAIVLISEHRGFLPGLESAQELVLKIQRLMVESQIPVVAALQGNATGQAWMLGLSCDACVYSKNGLYSAASTAQNPGTALFTHRFGKPAGKEILFSGAEYSGLQLQQRVGALLVAEQNEVLATCLRVAESWTRLPRATVAAWKMQTAAALRENVRGLPAAADWQQENEATTQASSTATPIGLRSKVVTATAHPGGIVVVKMEDRQVKNMFSQALVDGITEAFAHIEQTPAYKVVILTGYDSYFASGGTKESLLAIQAGKAKFTDVPIFQVARECRLPVIAAMQGHGIGAGLSLGMFADLVLLSGESRYVSPYMNFGFTPGAGATWILADTLGEDLARESLLTAQYYAGSEWKQRGLLIPVLPRAEVLAAAMALATQIAQASRGRLLWLKQQLTGNDRQPIQETLRLELAMHEKTFVDQPGTLAQIEKFFHSEIETPPAGVQKVQVELANPSLDGDLLSAVTASLRTLLASELQMQESDVDENVQFLDLGLDSIGTVTWVRKINDKYQTSIEATTIYSYPTLADFSRHVKQEAEKQGTLSSRAAPPVAELELSSRPERSAVEGPAVSLTTWRNPTASRFGSIAATAPSVAPTQAMAVIGMAGQFPQAKNIEEFWQNIAQGKNCITQVAAERWDVQAYYQPGKPVAGKTNSQWLGALEEYDRFDPLFFNLSPTEAESMDPQQRVFLEACWHSIENAGYDARSLSGSKCGVFVGCANADYHLLSREQRLSAQGFTGGATSILAARISYFLNLQGPCISIDTACSSSLVAIAQACDSLATGVSDLALAGGVFVMAGPELHIKTTQAGMLSPEGQCFSFDQRADGIVPGEAGGVVLLKRLADAQRDGDIIHAVIEGWGVNQDGKSNGITAPNPESQTRLEQEVYDRYQIDPASIQLIEAHGTGTKLGDPIEVEGLKQAFKKYTQNKEYCALGSVKSNIGHCTTAAGIAGFIKLVLALEHQQLPPTINFERLNEHIDLSDSPFYINSRLQEWKLNGAAKRQGAISSFGFSGTNAHVVVSEYLPPIARQRPVSLLAPNTRTIIPLSARTAEQLKQKARDLLVFLRNERVSPDLIEVAYTLQVGRQAMEERLGLLVSSVEQLAEKLEAYVSGEPEIKDVYQGQVKRNKEALSLLNADFDLQPTINKWIAEGRVAKLMELWVKGLDLDWSKLFGEVKPQRISLPLYPFAKERYWIDTATSKQDTVRGVSTLLHPLLHSNTSDLRQQRYSSTFTGEEFFLADHQVKADGLSEKVLPGVAYLEMARAAVELAWLERPKSSLLDLRHTVWAQPIVVAGNQQVSIALLPKDQSDQIDYEIYTQEGEQEILHCRGSAVWSWEPAPATLELEQLKEQMSRGRLDPRSVYAAFARMGLHYGPAHQAITALYLGEKQLLASLRLPTAVERGHDAYVLHPSLMDGALQACVGLMNGADSNQPRLPFALESLRVVSPCTQEMFAWVRYSPASQTADKMLKIDIDLCDERGNVCVQMRGFSARVLRNELAPSAQGQAIGTLLATPVWLPCSAEALTGLSKIAYAEHHLIVCELPKVNVETLRSSLPHSHCLSLQADGQKNIAQRYSEYALACLERIRAILESKPQEKVLVHLIVAGHPEQALFAGLSGLLQTSALENPLLIGQVILVPADITTGELAAKMLQEKTGKLDPLVNYAEGERQILQWQEVAAGLEKPARAFKDHGVYLITGGLGRLGLQFAREILAQTRESKVVLSGRSAISSEAQASLDQLCSPAGRVSYRRLDLGDLEQVKQLIVSIEAEHHQLSGILHSAGMAADNFILKKTSAEFNQVLAPKVVGTYNLDHASHDVDLDFFVLFSSVAAAMGNPGQADYAAANGFMDQFAAYRNRLVASGLRHGRTRSINWPLWEAGGMKMDSATQELVQQVTGMRPMQTGTGLEAFDRSLVLPYSRVLVAEGSLPQMRVALLSHQPIRPEPEKSVTADPNGMAIDPDRLTEKTQDYLRRQFSGLLKLPSHKIDPQAELERYGIDSILAMKLTTELEKTFGSLSKTLFFEYQTIAELSAYFAQAHLGRLRTLFATAAKLTSDASLPLALSVPVQMNSRRRFIALPSAAPNSINEFDPIAMIGLSGRYPEAVNIDAYWNNLRDGKDCIVEVPKERWDWQQYFSDDRTKSGQHYSKWGGFIAGVDEFDPLFFNISPKEAKYMDPQERLFLQHAWMAMEDAGYTRAGLQLPSVQDLPGQVGVYVGLMYSEYQLFGAEVSMQGRALGVAGSAASIANRVSYFLNLHGPSMTLDTMCSSSLTAIHLACQDLKQGRTSLAIAGGVNVSIHPNKYLVLSAGQFISGDGHCQSFGEGGDGYIPGEGVGVVVLKRLSEAKRDGDHIYGVIRGSALNHGGKTNGYTVPNPQAQAGVISRALAEAGTGARQISYIEAHGTGTKLGDPIEIAALSKAFQQYTQDKEFCLIGSAKSNIGHCESAAGIAGLTKVLLQMQHQQIVPSLHSAQLNPHIDFPHTPFTVNQSLRPWDPPVIEGQIQPRIAGISSFGAGGSNAHMIVEEYQTPLQPALVFAQVVILLSARTAGQLQQKAMDLLDFLRARPGTVDLVSLAYTLQVGREGMEERLGLVVNSVEQLTEKLQAIVAGDLAIEDFYQGQVKRDQETLSLFRTDPDMQQMVHKWIAGGKLSKLLELWVKGLELDWNELYPQAKPQRMSLPAYPFAKERYWIDIASRRQAAAGGAVSTVIHPLLHSNTSDLVLQRYSSTFSGEEFFLADHQVRADDSTLQRVLPRVAYLEMARAAVQLAWPAPPGSTTLELRQTIWAKPIVVSGNRQVGIALLPREQGQIDYEIYTQDGDQEIVHCQGSALWSHEPPPARIDLEQLKRQMGNGCLDPESVYAAFDRNGFIYGPGFRGITAIHQGSNQLLAHLRLSPAVAFKPSDYVLHPSLLEGALQACVCLVDEASSHHSPLGLESLRIVSASTPEMFAWVRYSAGRQASDEVVELDIDLCDERGNVSAQMRRLSWQQEALKIAEPPAMRKEVTVAATLPRELAFIPHREPGLVAVARKKPASISLSASGAYVSAATLPQLSAKRQSITLASAGSGMPVQLLNQGSAQDSSLRLFDRGHGIFSIEAALTPSRNGTPDQIAELRQALNRMRQEPSIKVLMLIGMEHCFSRDGRVSYNHAVEQKLYHTLVSFPYPLVAVVHGDAIGAGFLAVALCDFMVGSEYATYGYTDPRNGFYPSPVEAALLRERFGAVQAQDLLYISTALTGQRLRSKGWTCPLVPPAEVEARAEELASTLAAKSQDSLSLLKQHLVRHLVSLVKTLARVEILPAAIRDASAMDAETIASPVEYIHVESPAAGVALIRFSVAVEKVEFKELVADLTAVFAIIRQTTCYRAIVLVSEYPGFFPEMDLAGDGLLPFQRLLGESEVPVVAALERNASSHAWLLSQFCDASVYSRTGTYCAPAIGESPLVAQTSAAVFTYRFGNSVGKEILLTGAAYSGTELEQRLGALLAAEQDQVLPTAIRLAESWATLPRATLAAWKKHTATTLQEKIRNVPAAAAWEPANHAAPPFAAPRPVALRSKVVTAIAHAEGIVVVTMEDRQAKNMFSPALMDGIEEAFAHIDQTSAYKVVVLTGYDSYFASGGTKESLLAIQAGKAKFTDVTTFQAALDCKLPVIAAMQGHGIGAGLSLGMFADLVLLSEESRYVSPYMDYGFTPGAGATWILADKIGQDLARESLLTAQQYSGSAWKQRGLLLPVLPRAEVVAAAMVLARQIAQTSRGRLLWLKQQWTAYVRQPLVETLRRELAMHEQTFVDQSGTLAQIEKNFYQEIEAPPAVIRQGSSNSSLDSDLLPAVLASLRTLLASELQMQESDVDEDAQFLDLGLDSISTVTWVRKINEKYQTSIEATTIYSYPTLADFSRHVKQEAEKQGTLSSRAAPPVAEQELSSRPERSAVEGPAVSLVSWRSPTASRFGSAAPAAPAIAATQAMAVIGMAGQFPQAKNVEEFWQNIAQGKNCITQVAAERWDVHAYYQPGKPVAGKTNSQWLGALEEYDRFDPLFFNLSPTEAESMDPQQRVFLEACWHSIENAGYDARTLSGSKCGVFVGCANADYHLLSREQRLSAQGFTGGATSILAARISYFLNLQGPCISIDTACSSSLVAIAQACDSLATGVSDLALAGGVFVMAGPELHIKTTQAGMLSPQGQCFSFDQRADGIVPGEAGGVVLLKRLADAQRDGDIIHAVIEGWGVNQDGKSNGITAPNPESQTRLEQEVYDRYQIDPASIQLIEAHGTGTKLGDPIEVEGLKQAFKKYTQNKEYCALGSVKSNIGHCTTAAGIAGFIKLVLALEHKQLPPTINFERLNEHIDLSDSPFYINDRLQEWKLNGAAKRQGAISSFGFSGTNAHVVVSEYLPPIAHQRPLSMLAPNTRTIIPLSARTAEQLKQKARDLLAFLRAGSPDLIEVAYTLQVGRQAMEERLGLLVSSVEQLAEKLEAYVSGETEIKDVYQGQVKRNKEALSLLNADFDLKQTIDKWIAGSRLAKLLELWVKGMQLDWNQLYGEVKPKRISLPLYPFAKERYWIGRATSQQSPGSALPTGSAMAFLHPLLHRNTSDFSEQRYSSTFTGGEFFLADHKLRKDSQTVEPVLPLVAYLEMARAAIEKALPAGPESTVLELHHTVWAQPLALSEHKQVSIALFADDHHQVEYEIYSSDSVQEIVHCQGRALWSRDPAPARLDIEQLKGQMGQRHLDPVSLYTEVVSSGFIYGPALQAIIAIDEGSSQLLAQLRLPGTVAGTSGDYFLHPSLMDGALQAAVVLIDGVSRPNRLPFALESLRIVSPCTPEMFAWVRYSPGIRPADQVVKVDVDLCDERGNVCVQMRGLSAQVLSQEISALAAPTQVVSLLAAPVWQTSAVEIAAAGNFAYAEHHVVLCELSKVNAETLRTLLPNLQCLSLQAEQHKNIAQRYSDYAVACFEQIRSILQRKPQGKVLVHIVVGGHQEQAVFAGLSGLLKTAAMENPQLIGQLILVPADLTAEELGRRLQQEKAGKLDPLVKYEQDVRQVLRWEEIAAELEQPARVEHSGGISGFFPSRNHSNLSHPSPPVIPSEAEGSAVRPAALSNPSWEEPSPPNQALRDSAARSLTAFKDHGVYLITGGLGSLGLLFAKEILAQTREGRVVLAGRSAVTAEKQALLDGLSAAPGRLSYRQVDLDDLEQVKHLMATITQEHHQLNGILHSAGTARDNFIQKKTSVEFSQVLAPKVTGAYNLDQASQDVELDFFVLFSSVAAAMGNLGQADYATANGFMDQLAAYRNQQVAAGQRHGRTRSINWPLWKEGGMGMDPATQELLRQSTGLQPMQTVTGLQAFYRSLALPYNQMLVVEGNKTKIIAYLQKARLFESSVSTGNVASYHSPEPQTQTVLSLEQLQQHLKLILAEVLRIDTSIIDADQAFVEFGLDSFLAAALIVEVNKKYGTELSHITVFDYPNVREFSLLLQAEIRKLPGYSLPPAPRPQISAPGPYPVLAKTIRLGRTMIHHQAALDDKIAIIGMSGKYPQASNLQQYWNNLSEGRNCIREVPLSRWDVDRYYDPDRAAKDKTNSKWLGVLDDVDCFDPLFFRISPQEAEYMDPQHRLFLQGSYQAFEDAGYSSTMLSNKKCGVYLGISTNEYELLLVRNGILPTSVTSSSYAIAAARIAYYLNLKGPAISVDTACSSSLVSIHLACQGLVSRETDMALAGGVSLWLIPESYLAMSQAGMFSPVGQCKTFDDTADGIVNGEGVGAVVLKRLKDAQQDGDFIYGVILGSGINQDGKTNGITAPSVHSQIELERTVYDRYGIDPETISYVETHGTGTRLGDPIELQALATVFGERTKRRNFCALGSVKSNIGHTTAASGVAGVQKVLLSMQHRTLVPTLHVTRENSRFDFENSPFYVSREKHDWDVPPGSLRRAAVSSFGFSGTNAHLVIEEYPSPARQTASGQTVTVIMPLSARTVDQLKQRARDLLEFVNTAQSNQSTTTSPLDLAAVAYTLQVGRDAMEERLGFVVSSVEQLAQELSRYLSGEKNIERVYQGRVQAGNESVTMIGQDDDMQGAVDRWLTRRKLPELLNLWIRGLAFDWNKLYDDEKPSRISLPAYPFAKEHYWIDEMPVSRSFDSSVDLGGSRSSIEDIIDRMGDEMMEAEDAVKALKTLV